GGCSITLINVTEPECQAAPFDDQSSFTVTFNVTGGSGQYFLSNPNTNILNGSSGPPGGQPTDGIISFNGQADITGNTEGTMAPVRLYNSANPSECFVDFMINVPVCPEPSCPTEAFINEFHYDNAGGDVGEFIEVAVSDDFMGNLSDLKVELYNGNGGSSYNILELSSATEGSTEGGYTYYTLNLPSNGLQNGSPDGMALACGTTLIEFLSYEGTMTASNGVANGMTSTDVGVAESSSQVIGGSIQLIDNVWTLTCDDTPGAANALGLPCGWSDSEGVGCTAGATTYDPSTETFTLSSGDCQIGGYPYTADQISFVHEELCGDGTIKAYIEAVNGNGIAGIQMRETLDPGAKKVEIGTNRTNRIVRAYRFTNNYPAFPQELYSLDKFWLKIERTGNTFKAFASVDDIVYYPYLFQTISMGSCIEAGIFVYSKDGSAVTADFTDVEVINGPIPFAAEIKDVTQSEANTTALGSGTTNAFATANTATANIGLTPNPARDVVTLNLDQVIGEETIIRIFNINGQLMNQLQFDRVEDANHDINIDELPAGTYYVNVRTTSTQQTLKLIKQ
ncbi:MAG: T9SS type A sorting domain-containing protein, partial [Saprospiraceae bacterium]|nr:T9SS type A sorting domain-containing protein [Saprospiraceae bacterium]